jgi:hypothetical protein
MNITAIAKREQPLCRMFAFSVKTLLHAAEEAYLILAHINNYENNLIYNLTGKTLNRIHLQAQAFL